MKTKDNFIQVMNWMCHGLTSTLILQMKLNQERLILKMKCIFQQSMARKCIHKYS
jgi:hypothetical protein